MIEIDQLLDVLNRMVTGNAATLEVLRLVRDRHDDDIAELRDELHALANRVETLTRARLTEPAEVAEAVVRHKTRREWAFCRECNTHHSFTEGKCDFCSTPIVGVGETI